MKLVFFSCVFKKVNPQTVGWDSEISSGLSNFLANILQPTSSAMSPISSDESTLKPIWTMAEEIQWEDMK